MIYILLWAACIYGCYTLAKGSHRNPGLAALMGALFGIFALGAYLLIGSRYDGKFQPRRTPPMPAPPQR